jgi:hypothetical protein
MWATVHTPYTGLLIEMDANVYSPTGESYPALRLPKNLRPVHRLSARHARHAKVRQPVIKGPCGVHFVLENENPPSACALCGEIHRSVEEKTNQLPKTARHVGPGSP